MGRKYLYSPIFLGEGFKDYLHDCMWEEDEEDSNFEIWRGLLGQAGRIALLPVVAIAALVLDIYQNGGDIRERTYPRHSQRGKESKLSLQAT